MTGTLFELPEPEIEKPRPWMYQVKWPHEDQWSFFSGETPEEAAEAFILHQETVKGDGGLYGVAVRVKQGGWVTITFRYSYEEYAYLESEPVSPAQLRHLVRTEADRCSWTATRSLEEYRKEKARAKS